MAEDYPVLSKSAAARRLDDLRADDLYPHHHRDQSSIGNAHVRRLIGALDHMRGSLASRGRGRRFDRYASRVIHQAAQDLPTHMQEDAGFWRWLAIEQGADIVEHRYGATTHAGKDNFGLGGRWESMFRRLWIRAEISIDAGATDPYWMTKLGDVDFWASGVLRHRYSSARNLVKAFVAFAYDDPNQPADDRWIRAGEPNRELGIRILYKKLKRLHATVAYEVLDINQCTEILERLSQDLPHTNH